MLCKKCGKVMDEKHNYCTNCGTQLTTVNPTMNGAPIVAPAPKPWWNGKIISILIFGLAIGVGIYNSIDKNSITKNNAGLQSFQAGDSETAIEQLKQATETAVTDENKLNSLKNLAYVYSTDGDNERALETFKMALNLTKENTFDYWLLSGEIATYENKPDAAVQNFNKAYELSPTDFQINSALALFYLDIDEIAPQYADNQKALHYAKKAYEYDTDKSDSIAENLAIAYYFNNEFNSAIELLLPMNFAQRPYDALWLSLAYAGNGDSENAKLYMQKAVENGIELPSELTGQNTQE